MKKIVLLIVPAILLNLCLSAQKQEVIVVKAGTKLLDYFTVKERYLYSEFTPGKILLLNGNYSVKKLNYNFLAGEIEFIDKTDTLSIANKRDIKLISVAQDTFHYDKGYIEQIRSNYPKVGLKQFIELKEIQTKDTYGVSSTGGASTTYSSLPVDGSFYKLVANKDMLFKKTIQYYISTKDSGFQFFNRKTVLALFPENEDKIREYLKANRIKFDSREDLLRLADFLGTL
jgi:hypothetical protein